MGLERGLVLVVGGIVGGGVEGGGFESEEGLDDWRIRMSW